MNELFYKIMLGDWCSDFLQSCSNSYSCTCSPLLPPMILVLPILGYLVFHRIFLMNDKTPKESLKE